MKTKLAQAIVDYWDLPQAKAKSLIEPEHQVLTHQGFAHFMKNAQKLMIAGDYDCDGVMSTTIAALCAEKLEIPYGYYIPNRLKEGYGLKEATVRLAYEKGYTDLLLVDNGVKAQEAILLALELGLNVAVVDHHLIEDDLTDQALWVHPDLLDDPYFADMSAGGLMAALAEGMGLDDPYITALGALATVADVMPLWGKNRDLCYRGVNDLNQYRFVHFEKLVNTRYLHHYTAQVLAFQISPKINTLGRLSDQANINTAVQYFLSEDQAVINSFAQQLLSLNTKRKQMSKQIEALALSQVNDDSVQIISSKHFHEGLLGIVANTVAAETLKPSILLKEYDAIYKGSARSMTVSLQALFSQLPQEYFVNMGGHDFAYGLTLKKEHYPAFVKDVNRLSDMMEKIAVEKPVIEVPISWITQEALQEIKQFEPLGEGLQLPQLQVEIPENKQVYAINGYGYKYRFFNSNVAEAVYFNNQISLIDMEQAKQMRVSLDLQSADKIQVYIEELI
ncbi:MAG TPA: DHHA1 domain-containing protein [Erysipelothrix sp.]